MVGEPFEHALPAIAVALARLRAPGESFMPQREARPRRARFEAIGDRRRCATVPIWAPGLDQLAGRVDLQELALGRERLSVGADALAAPRAADPEIPDVSRDAIGVGGSPPACQLLRRERAKHALRRDGDLYAGE